jgi:hypothetical protein
LGLSDYPAREDKPFFEPIRDMTLPNTIIDPAFRIYLALAQYPILKGRIRMKMQCELISRGIISQIELDNQVREQALRSQEREGLMDPYGEEPAEVWSLRMARVRDQIIDLYFANNLPFEYFEEIARKTLAEHGAESDDLLQSFNPELAPMDMLFDHALAIKNMPLEERKRYSARLQEIKVVLIRMMISDQLAYVNIAKQWFTIDDLLNIRQRKIGAGKVGGKAAGMLLAQRILNELGEEDITSTIDIPESYFLGANVMYDFMTNNEMIAWSDQKYKSEEEIRSEYPIILEEYQNGQFPTYILERLTDLLENVGKRPIIVRSSGLLEDNFGTSFAGKYDSYFCPNQSTPEENLKALTHAISRVYASALSPDALLYRHSRGLVDYDERIAVLIQLVQGESFEDYYLPHAAGVAFSRNLFRWSPEIKREDGFVRLVWGLGTRAVERVGNDYPRLVALSHPLLHSQVDPKAISRYSQRFVDLIDLQDNTFKTLPVKEVLNRHYPVLRPMVQLYQDGYLSSLHARLLTAPQGELVITFEELLHRSPFAERLRRMLRILESTYHSPVDLEFTVRVKEPNAANPEVEIFLLQCRPQSHLQESTGRLPGNLEEGDIIFSTGGVIPHGYVQGIRWVLFVPHEGYFALRTPSARAELSRNIGRLNAELADEVFICVGPGRWGTANSDLGVRIGYSDIYHTRALVELSGEGVGPAPEPSFGTHFFQDLIESQIYPLAIFLDKEDVIFRRDFFYHTPNHLDRVLPKEGNFADSLRLIKVGDYRPGYHIDLTMDDGAGRAVAYLVQDKERM